MLQGVSLSEVLGGIELLIGADISEAHRTLEYRISQVGGSNAVRRMLGWSSVNPTNGRVATQTPKFRVNFVRSESSMLHEQMQRVYETLLKQMIQMYQQYFNKGIDSSKVTMSVEDCRALAIRQDCTQLQNGHYMIPLPWKSSQVKLPRNRTMAERRLAYLRAKLLGDKDLFHNYKDKIKEYLDKRYDRKVSTDLPYTDRTWFIPHHATVGKCRVVFDWAARFQGVSLNDNLLQGPDHTSNLMGILLRFRKKPLAVVADIRGMFYQVRVEPRECDSLRFLWWPDGDLSIPPQKYQMLVHLFGAIFSPSCCYFLMSKSRVVPLKPVTIPCMELTAAVVGVNLVKFLGNEIDLELESVIFWTDSTSVLQYINNTAKRFHVFFSNRRVEIYAGSDPSQWRHLDSKFNPANIWSRGLMLEQLNKAKAWFVGPPFLKLPEKHWPEQPTLSPKLDGLEIRTRTNATLAQNTHNSALDRLLNSSSFSGLKRKVAWVLRYRQYLLANSQPNVLVGTRSHSLTVSELDVAARKIIKLVQKQSFPEEVSKLARSVSSNSCQPDSSKAKSCSVSKHPCLRKLCPILVQGLIRVGARLQRSPFSLDVKHPIILPKNHHVTHLIINFFYQKE